MQLKHKFTAFLCILAFLLMSGCTSTLWNRYPPPLPTKAGLVTGAVSGAAIGAVASGGVGAGVGAVMGGIVGASFGNIIQSHYTLVDKLQYYGVEVVQLGDEVKIILPTERFFQPNSALMNMQYYPVMNMVAGFIKKFQKITVKVAGYTNDKGAWQRNLALSESQAKTVMQYLWNYGIDVRLLYAKGYGEANPIANNNTLEGQYMNQRIEITLRRIRNVNDDI